MASELATINKHTELAKSMPEFSTEQIRILGETVAKGATQDELAFFLNVCKLKRLDPFGGQVHCVKRWDSDLGREKMTIQVGIDGFRVIAARTGEHAGTTEPEYDSEDAQHPNWARVIVYRYGRNDEKIPYSVKARYSEFVVTKKGGEPNRMWATKPYVMLAKCAEAQALRKAFPDELSGMYTEEEMGQADNEGGVTPASVTKPPVSMPKSVDEKKPAAAEQQKPAQAPPQAPTTSTANPPAETAPATEKISGEILSVTPGKNGVLVLNVDKKVVVVPGRLASKEMVQGAKILCTVVKVLVKDQKVLQAHTVEMITPPVIEGEIVEEQPRGVHDPKLDEYRNAGLDGLFGEDISQPKPPTKTEPDPPPASADAAKPGTIGVKRAKRLYTLISQNHKNTGFTEEECKKVMSALPVPIEHLRDLELGMYSQFEKWALGEEDYQDFWKE